MRFEHFGQSPLDREAGRPASLAALALGGRGAPTFHVQRVVAVGPTNRGDPAMGHSLDPGFGRGLCGAPGASDAVAPPRSRGAPRGRALPGPAFGWMPCSSAAFPLSRACVVRVAGRLPVELCGMKLGAVPARSRADAKRRLLDRLNSYRRTAPQRASVPSMTGALIDSSECADESPRRRPVRRVPVRAWIGRLLGQTSRILWPGVRRPAGDRRGGAVRLGRDYTQSTRAHDASACLSAGSSAIQGRLGSSPGAARVHAAALDD
jgi:hypothetical protein